MRLENLFQFIVPLTFLAIWALTTLLNRDAQPLPPRPARPGGPRPGPGLGPGPGQRQAPGPATARPPARLGGGVGPSTQGGGVGQRPQDPAGWNTVQADSSGLAPRRLPPRPASSPDDAIVYLENDPTGSRTPSRPLSAGSEALAQAPSSRSPRGSSPRRGGRSRSAAGNLDPRKPAAPETQRRLSDQVQQSLSRQKARPLEIAPLLTPLTQSIPSPAAASPSSAAGTGQSERPTLTGEEIRAMLVAPNRVREAFILAEILQPPVALRPRSSRGA